MIYFCADDYGISPKSNERIEYCLKNGALNKISVLPNGDVGDFKNRLPDAKLSLHINLVEGYSVAKAEDVSMLVTEKGDFKYSFAGLFLLSISPKRKELKKQLYKEISAQVKLWTEHMGKDDEIWLDSHQHTHMIPLVFKTLCRVIREEGIKVRHIRIPAEPLAPYILTPSMYHKYSVSGLAKQWILKFLALLNRREFKKSKINSALFMGMVFSGKLTEKTVNKFIPKYLKIAEKNKRIKVINSTNTIEEIFEEVKKQIDILL